MKLRSTRTKRSFYTDAKDLIQSGKIYVRVDSLPSVSSYLCWLGRNPLTFYIKDVSFRTCLLSAIPYIIPHIIPFSLQLIDLFVTSFNLVTALKQLMADKKQPLYL